MRFTTAKQITSSFVKNGWNKDTSFAELTLDRAEQKGLTFAIEGIRKGVKYFVMNATGNVFDSNGEVAYLNIIHE